MQSGCDIELMRSEKYDKENIKDFNDNCYSCDNAYAERVFGICA